ncbi:MAG: hypothetical protein R3240_04760, partial [Gammaproteobacteria bacterium]|nr:hypothetical protein [Gammaproteobacteria bacterium]
MATDSTTSIYHLFSRSLLRLIAQKAALFPCIGFIDLPSYSIINESIIHLSSNDLQAASEQLQGIELENIRWYVNMESDSAGTVAFARFLENLYRSASYNPTVYIEYLTFEENPWLASRLEEGFVVSRFSRVTEKYIPSSVLSGSYSIVLYAYLLASARILQEQFIETLASDFNLNTFQKSLRLTQHNGERDVTEVAFYILFPLLELQRTAGITLVYNRLWDKLRADEKAYLEEQLAQGLDEISFFALLLNFSDIRFTDIQLNAQQFLLAADFEHIVKSTLPEDVRDKKNIALYMGQGRNWDELQLHPLYKLKIDRYLNYNPRWRQWLTNKINRPLVTLRDWRIFFIAAIQLHQASLAEFNQICGYEVIGPMEHDEYREQLYAAQSIVTAALKAAMQFYLLQHPEEEAINRALHETDITLFVDNHLSMAEQQKDVYSFLSKVAAAYNRLEHIAPAAARDISGLEFVSRYLEPQQCETISRHLKKLVAMLCELADAEIYLKALVDAFHELHYTGHNPSISVHNVLMDNKYHIYHRDVNFVRVARRSAKQLDMLIEQYGEVVRDKIVE